jgi:hypothetical protein
MRSTWASTSIDLGLDLVDLALAVLLTARLEHQHLRVLGEVLCCCSISCSISRTVIPPKG